MADEFDKTEDPTPKKQMESREKGQLGKSTDLNAAIIMGLAILFLYLFGHNIVKMHLNAGDTIFKEFMNIGINEDNLQSQSEEVLYFVMGGMMPFLMILFVASILSNVVQIGFLWTFKPMTPDFGKINPIKGLKQKFSLKTLMLSLMNILKTIVISWVAYLVISEEWNAIFRTTGENIIPTMSLFANIFFKLALYIILVMFILAIIDFAYQKWQNHTNMKMSKQEVKDELKNFEGDPKIKQKRRQIQLQMSRQRMMKDVQDADVVITNPTHFSIAIKYDEHSMKAPVVVAKGADLLALRIREIAKLNDVPLVENKLLARQLYQSVEVGEEIPQKLFKAVAEILAYVYNLRSDKKKAGRAV